MERQQGCKAGGRGDEQPLLPQRAGGRGRHPSRGARCLRTVPETEDDDLGSQDEAVGNDSDVADYTRQARPFPGDRAPKAPKLPPARKISDSQREQATLIGMELGIDAFNDVMGWS